MLNRKKPTKELVTSIRLEKSDIYLIDTEAAEEGISRGAVIRRIVKRHNQKMAKKALTTSAA